MQLLFLYLALANRKFMYYIIGKFSFIIILLLAMHDCYAAESNPSIENGRSPDGMMEVVNINAGDGRFIIINDKGETLFSGESIQDKYINNIAFPVWKVLWRHDSKFVAIAFSTSKFAEETVVLRRDGNALQQVELPAFNPFDWEHAKVGSSDNTHRVPYAWHKNGDLIIDITSGYHTKSDGGLSGYFIAVHFVGNPLKAVKGAKSKTTMRQ